MASRLTVKDRKNGKRKPRNDSTIIYTDVVQIGNNNLASIANDDGDQHDVKTKTRGGKRKSGFGKSKAQEHGIKKTRVRKGSSSKLTEIKDVPESIDKETRMIVFGKTGSGKSATCNTILGRQGCEDAASLSSITEACSIQERIRQGRQITVVDTPGMFDTERSQAETINSMVECISYSSPGPHAFLLILSCRSRFTDEEYNTMRSLTEIFGEDVYKYAIAIFTNADVLSRKTKTEFLETCPTNLRYILDLCETRVLFLNNNDSEDEKERYVNELLDMVDEMVSHNEAPYYTHSMFKAHYTSAERIAKAIAAQDYTALKEEMETLIKLLKEMKSERGQLQQQIMKLNQKFKASESNSKKEKKKNEKAVTKHKKQLKAKENAIKEVEKNMKRLERTLENGRNVPNSTCILL